MLGVGPPFGIRNAVAAYVVSAPMLRVSIDQIRGFTVYKLEGDLAGAWVDELREAWFANPASKSRKTDVVDLNGVIRIDAAGLHLLSVMNIAGVRFVSRAPYTRSLLAEFSTSVLEELPET